MDTDTIHPDGTLDSLEVWFRGDTTGEAFCGFCEQMRGVYGLVPGTGRYRQHENMYCGTCGYHIPVQFTWDRFDREEFKA